jgi:hypothetical protein
MDIKFEHNGKKIVLVYASNGKIEHIIDTETKNKMMIEYTQIGSGYELTNNDGFIPAKMCNADYVRIMELDIFVPKFIYILPNI